MDKPRRGGSAQVLNEISTASVCVLTVVVLPASSCPVGCIDRRYDVSRVEEGHEEKLAKTPPPPNKDQFLGVFNEPRICSGNLRTEQRVGETARHTQKREVTMDQPSWMQNTGQASAAGGAPVSTPAEQSAASQSGDA